MIMDGYAAICKKIKHAKQLLAGELGQEKVAHGRKQIECEPTNLHTVSLDCIDSMGKIRIPLALLQSLL